MLDVRRRLCSCLLLLVLLSAARVLAQSSDGEIDELISRIRNGSDKKRLAAVATLAARGPKAAAAVEPLVVALNDEDIMVRWWGAYALGEIGPSAEKALPAINRALDSDDVPLKTYAAIALCKISPQKCDRALPTLCTALWNSNPAVQAVAADAIGAMGPAGKDAIPDLASVAMYNSREGPRPILSTGRFDFPPTTDRKKPVMILNKADVDAGARHYSNIEWIDRSLDFRGLDDLFDVPRKAALDALGKIGPAARGARLFVWHISLESNPIISRAAEAALRRIEQRDDQNEEDDKSLFD